MALNTTPKELESVLFRAGLFWRIGYGALRGLFGLALLKFVGMPLSQALYDVMRHELVEDPSDSLVQMFGTTLAHHHLTVTYFLAAYFIFWGVLDVGLSLAMLFRILWAFPVSIALIVVFTAYEMYRYTHTHSIILLGVVLVDIVIVWLISREYERHRRALLQTHT